MKERLARLPWRAIARWWIVGIAFTAGGLGVLYLLRDILHWPLIVGTSAGAEITLLIRFLINDRWVFGHPHPTWKRLFQFHVAGAGGGAVWWIVANALPRLGVHYLIAALVGTACSVVLSLITNFLWIWRGDGREPLPVRVKAEAADGD